jgi:tripartite ATP-independent transporter DctM subunit
MTSIEWAAEALGPLMFATAFLLLMLGFPVGFTLIGTAFLFALGGSLFGVFDFRLLSALPLRLVGILDNDLLQAVPVFLFLGVILQRTRLAADLLEGLGRLFGHRAGGLGVASLLIGALLAPTTGAVGATVLTLGLLALPSMLAAGYDRRLASGIVCAAGTLGTILPPSIILILLGEAMRGASVEAELARGAPVKPLIVADIYLGALLPVALLLGLYILYVVLVAWRAPGKCPPLAADPRGRADRRRLLLAIVLPILLIVLMLALIVTGYAYTVEAAACGAVGAALYAGLRGELSRARLGETVREVTSLTAMVFLLLIGASTFSLVFRGFSGDLVLTRLLLGLPGGTSGAVIAVMAVIFVLGFFLDSLEIIFLVVPIAMPPLLLLGVDPIWLAVLTAVNLQTSFLLPPFGFALCFLRGVAPPEIRMGDILRGVAPLVVIQLLVLGLIWQVPALVVGLPRGGGAPPAAATSGPPGAEMPTIAPPDSDSETLPEALREITPPAPRSSP